MSFDTLGNRHILKKGTKLTLYYSHEDAVNKKNGETFTIISGIESDSVTKYGSTSICYYALDEDNCFSILKEYYPGYLPIRREEDMSLTCLGFQDKYDKGYNNIVASGKRINTILNNISTARNYFSHFYVLFGYNTVYTFSKFDKVGLTFDEYISAQLSFVSSSQQYEGFVINVLKCIKSLSDAVALLHDEGYVFLDIHPKNFMLIKKADNTFMTDTIYIFDIDALIHTDEILEQEYFDDLRYTEYFSSPLQKSGFQGDAGYYKELDAYSILATLYYALSGRFLPKSADKLIEGLYRSPILKKSKLLSQKGFKSSIKNLFLNTVSNHFSYNRGANAFDCHTISRALKNIISLYKQTEAGMVSKSKKHSPKLSSEFSRSLMFHNLLFRSPLFNYKNNTVTTVSVIGEGVISSDALSAILPISMIPGSNVRLVLINSGYDLESFLEAFPDVSAYSSNNNFITSLSERVVILEKPVAPEDIPGVISKLSITYIICSHEDDRINRKYARIISQMPTDVPLFIGYVQLSKTKNKIKNSEMISPISKIEDIPEELGRLTYNCHYVLEKKADERISTSAAERRLSKHNAYKQAISYALQIYYAIEYMGICSSDSSLSDEEIDRITDQLSGSAAGKSMTQQDTEKHNLEVCFSNIPFILAHRPYSLLIDCFSVPLYSHDISTFINAINYETPKVMWLAVLNCNAPSYRSTLDDCIDSMIYLKKFFLSRHYYPKLILNILIEADNSDEAKKRADECTEKLALKKQHYGIKIADNIRICTGSLEENIHRCITDAVSHNKGYDIICNVADSHTSPKKHSDKQLLKRLDITEYFYLYNTEITFSELSAFKEHNLNPFCEYLMGSARDPLLTWSSLTAKIKSSAKTYLLGSIDLQLYETSNTNSVFRYNIPAERKIYRHMTPIFELLTKSGIMTGHDYNTAVNSISISLASVSKAICDTLIDTIRSFIFQLRRLPFDIYVYVKPTKSNQEYTVHAVELFFKDLRLSAPKEKAVFEKLISEGYIERSYSLNNDHIYLCDRNIYDILTTENSLLKYIVYEKLTVSNLFDDICADLRMLIPHGIKDRIDIAAICKNKVFAINFINARDFDNSYTERLENLQKKYNVYNISVIIGSEQISPRHTSLDDITSKNLFFDPTKNEDSNNDTYISIDSLIDRLIGICTEI